jgi:hypothetical protein
MKVDEDGSGSTEIRNADAGPGITVFADAIVGSQEA